MLLTVLTWSIFGPQKNILPLTAGCGDFPLDLEIFSPQKNQRDAVVFFVGWVQWVRSPVSTIKVLVIKHG
jgi:hypothetical protein